MRLPAQATGPYVPQNADGWCLTADEGVEHFPDFLAPVSYVEASALTGPISTPTPRWLLDRLSDDQLVTAVRRGEDAAFAALYDRYHRPLLTFCRHMLSSREDAEDVVQITFGAAFREIRESGDGKKYFRRWLYTVARNRCLNTLRARRETPTEELEPISTAGLSEEVERRAELRHLIADLKSLPEKKRAALLLFEAADLGHREIAEVLDCERQQVKAYVFQARSSLMASREAREIPCLEVQQQLATATRGGLRRAWLKRHLRQCDGCRDFAEGVRHQRQALALALPTAPSLGLKQSTLAAAGGGSAGGGAAGGGLVASVGASGAAKALVTGLAAAGLVGGVALEAALPGTARAGSDRARDSLALGATGSADREGTLAGHSGRPFGPTSLKVAEAGGTARAAAGKRRERSARSKASARSQPDRRTQDRAGSPRRAGADSNSAPRRTGPSRRDRLAALRKRAADATAALPLRRRGRRVVERARRPLQEHGDSVSSAVDRHARRASSTVDEGVDSVLGR